MVLKPQDVYVLLKILALREADWSFLSLSKELFMSSSEVHAAVKRAIAARLMDPAGQRPIAPSLEEFLLHGVRYAFPPDRGGPTRGVPTSWAAMPLKRLVTQPDGLVPVWPDPEGTAQGYSFSPIYRTAPKAAKIDGEFYELLALLDAIRDGRARERDIAAEEMRRRLNW